jgi:PGF-pre-PGF domain-containing protein
MKNNINKILLGIFSLSLFILPVLGLYDTNVIPPKYENGGEVYGVSIGATQGVIFYPENCTSIDKVTIMAKNQIDGTIIVTQENNDSRGKDLTLVYEICKLEMKDMSKSDIESILVSVKVKKSWLTDNKLTKDQLTFYSYDESKSKWNTNSLSFKKESIEYYYFETKPQDISLWAVAKSTSGDSNGDILTMLYANVGWVLLCCILLLLFLVALMVLIARRRKQEQEQGIE